MYINNKVTIINKTEVNNFFCSICNFPLITIDDFKKNDEYDCCEECFLKFVEPRKQEWLAGYRPTKERIDEYINFRKQLCKRIIKITKE